MRMTLAEVAQGLQAIGDIFDAAEEVVTRVNTDSRVVKPGEIFVCIAGQNFDGHSFAAEAVRKGAVAVVAMRPFPREHFRVPVLLVKDTVVALGELARFWRNKTSAKVVGVTGSAGKTTVKELVASVLSVRGKTARNYKNLNNQIGLALSILNTDGDELFWVMEAGVSRPGDMDDLQRILHPDLALITNIGMAHTEGLGGLAGVAGEKAKLMIEAPLAVVGGDYPELTAAAKKYQPGAEIFSLHDESTRFFCRYHGMTPAGRGRFELRLDGRILNLELPFSGEHMAENVLATATTATLLGLSGEEIASGLKQAVLPGQRFQCKQVQGWTVVDDTYNANPLSMRRAIQAAQELRPKDPLVLVLGEMGELGEHSAVAHRELGQTVAQSPSRIVFFRGVHHAELFDGLSQPGWNGLFQSVNTPKEFLAGFHDLDLQGGTILFKGSRSCRMEDYLRAFIEELAA